MSDEGDEIIAEIFRKGKREATLESFLSLTVMVLVGAAVFWFKDPVDQRQFAHGIAFMAIGMLIHYTRKLFETRDKKSRKKIKSKLSWREQLKRNSRRSSLPLRMGGRRTANIIMCTALVPMFMAMTANLVFLVMCRTTWPYFNEAIYGSGIFAMLVWFMHYAYYDRKLMKRYKRRELARNDRERAMVANMLTTRTLSGLQLVHVIIRKDEK